eukprot:TRINITY_DN9990_c0_g2_i1.p2 TRINITY_DN9990_c0_g2~~TRINITY_DN9990_c0_g2_i1.p2  ORF type:complete len:120 (+),score=10.09 TRINITY_DN9990_c0_g2_i1:365-724(+)
MNFHQQNGIIENIRKGGRINTIGFSAQYVWKCPCTKSPLGHVWQPNTGEFLTGFPQGFGNPHLAIVSPRGLGLVKTLIVDPTLLHRVWNSLVLQIYVPKPIFLSYTHLQILSEESSNLR